MQQQPQSHVRPKGKVNAYLFFTSACRAEHKKFYPNETLSIRDFSRKCSERWRAMGPQERLRYQEYADEDKRRHEREMLNYCPPKGRGKYRSRDPTAPKRPLCGFFMFCRYERKRVKSMYPGIRLADVAKILARLWAEAGPDVKNKYEQMAIQDKARYEMEMTTHKKKTNTATTASPLPPPPAQQYHHPGHFGMS